MVQFLKAAFLLTALAAVSGRVVVSRDVPTLLTDLEAASSAITTLQGSIDSFDGTLNRAIAVHNGALAVGSAVDTATDEANNIPAFTADESAQVLTSVQGIADQTTTALDAIVAKAGQFNALGPIVTTLVNQDLDSLQTSSDNLSDALIAKATEEDAATGAQIKADLDAAFADAKAAFA